MNKKNPLQFRNWLIKVYEVSDTIKTIRCAVLPEWHSTTFRRRKKERLKALLTKKYCKGG